MRKMILLLVLLMLTSGCAASQRDTNNAVVVEPSIDNYNPETEAEDGGVENNMGTQAERTPSPWFVEWLAEQEKINVKHIIRGDYTPADRDVDFSTIERFVFTTREGYFGDSIVIDRMYGNVYHTRDCFATFLESYEHSAEFRDEDLERLITALEKSGVRDWDVRYQGDDNQHIMAGVVGWDVGLLFSDGTMMRRGGGGTGGIMTPPEAQFSILTDFIESMGAEVIKRHNAENDS